MYEAINIRQSVTRYEEPVVIHREREKERERDRKGMEQQIGGKRNT